MDILKQTTYKGKYDIYNIYICKSKESHKIYLMYDCDPFYGGLTFGAEVESFISLKDAEIYAQNKYNAQFS